MRKAASSIPNPYSSGPLESPASAIAHEPLTVMTPRCVLVGSGVFVGVNVRVRVGTRVADPIGDGDAVKVAVGMPVCDGVGVTVGVPVSVGVGVGGRTLLSKTLMV